MLNNATGFDRIYIACGYTDLRQGIDGLSAVIRRQLGVDPFQKNVLFMFCGRKPDKINYKLFVLPSGAYLRDTLRKHLYKMTQCMSYPR